MRSLRLLFAMALLGAFGFATAPAQTPDSCTVAFVLDGDTFNCRGGGTVKLGLVDAPEGGSFGNIARRALATLLPAGTPVRLEFDEKKRDADGRLLSYVFLPDGRFANEILVRLGYAFFEPDPANDRYSARLRRAEERARSKGIGVWSR